jgi:SAM-dependent methyltransferase
MTVRRVAALSMPAERNPLADTDRTREAGLVGYQQGLAALAKYAPERQRALKLRVFETVDQLLRRRGHAGLVRGARLVDIGSADGALVSVCQDRGLNATGLDAADGLDFERDTLPVPSDSVDVVTAISVIEHLRSPVCLLRESRRILRPGGAIIFVCPNWRYSWRVFFDDPTHVHPYTQISLARVLRDHHFAEIGVFPWLVKKPAWLLEMPAAFFVARWLLPFRGDAPRFIPAFLRGRSASLLAIGRKPSVP